MVCGGVLSSLISLVINTYYTGKLLKIGLLIQIKDMLPIIVISSIMWLFIHILMLFLVDVYLQLFVGIVAGLFIYIFFSKLFLNSEWKYLVSMIPNRC